MADNAAAAGRPGGRAELGTATSMSAGKTLHCPVRGLISAVRAMIDGRRQAAPPRQSLTERYLVLYRRPPCSGPRPRGWSQPRAGHPRRYREPNVQDLFDRRFP